MTVRWPATVSDRSISLQFVVENRLMDPIHSIQDSFQVLIHYANIALVVVLVAVKDNEVCTVELFSVPSHKNVMINIQSHDRKRVHPSTFQIKIISSPPVDKLRIFSLIVTTSL